LAICAGDAARAQSPTLRVAELRTALLGSDQTAASPHAGQSDAVAALIDYAKALPDPDEQPILINAEASQGHASVAHDDAYAALIDYAERIAPSELQIKLAKAEKPKSVVKATPDAEATYVGAQACVACHAVQVAAFNATLMGKIFRNPRNAQERANCETCHGPASLHVKAGGGRGVGGLVSFRLDDASHTPDEYNGICLSCHEKGHRTYWRGSTHEMRGLVCTNCHTIMTNVTPHYQLAKLTEIDTCFQCHKNKRAEIWRSSHMPVREGKMTCSTCHNPHGSYAEAMLKDVATINDNCYKCHAEKRGPFLWEHAPVRENCANCHDPHGSINDFLLKISRPRLCQQCHANLTGHPGNPRNPLSIYAINRECQNCHSQHHGSNSPAGSRFIR
jgi:DmsE family decaheme c-type cytochrome